MRISITSGQGTDLADIRRENLHRVLDVARRVPGCSQNDIARQTGLGIGAVSSLVNDLLAAGILVEGTAEAQRGRGRPKRAVSLADHRVDLIGISLMRSRIDVQAATLRGSTLGAASADIPGPVRPEHAAETIVRLVGEVVGDRQVAALGPRVVIAFPGVVAGDGLGGSEIEWVDVDPRILTGLFDDRGWPETLVGNDGSLAAFAEARSGSAAGHSNAVVLFLGRGLGGSAIVDGALIRGATAAPGFGHTPLDPEGEVCDCGLRGCAELTVGLWRLAERLGEADSLERMEAHAFALALADRAAAGEERVLDVLATAGTTLARLGDIVTSLLNPERVVLTGPGALLAPWIMPRAVGNVAVPTALGAFGESAAIGGALAAAQEIALSDPLHTGGGRPADWI